MSVSKPGISVCWLRRDLRLHDNAALFHALQSGFPVLPVFIFDDAILNQLDDKADKRVDLIYQMLENIQQKLQTSEASIRIFHGSVKQAFETLTSEYDLKKVFCNRDYEPYALQRDAEIRDFLNSKNIEFHSYKDQVIFEWNEVLKADGTPYTVFTPYSRVWKKQLSEIQIPVYPTEKYFAGFYKSDKKFQFPKLEEIGFQKTGVQFQEPKTEIHIIENYHLTRDTPSLETGTTGLSLHLRFGTVNVRELVKIAKVSNETWLNELIWREFFMSILMHFPHVAHGAFKKQYDAIAWRNNEDEFLRWCNGTTGFPIVDAGMRQLNETGLMHNRVRMITASFLVKDLLIDWRWGEAYFASKLFDYDLSANNGNWQWAAGCGCDAAPYFRIFNPAEQTKRYDPELKYIRRWVPEINEFGYPAPIVDHSMARERTLKAFKEALNNI
jgi:deoxyribodipyrimidine photo-lyase